MKEFFLILFFSKTILLTPEPIRLAGELELSPEKPLSAITAGAEIRIDITKSTKGINIKQKGIIESRKLLRERIPKGSIQAELISKSGKTVLDVDGFALSDDGAMLILTSSTGIPLDTEFDKVKIFSRINLSDVLIYWKNFRH